MDSGHFRSQAPVGQTPPMIPLTRAVPDLSLFVPQSVGIAAMNEEPERPSTIGVTSPTHEELLEAVSRQNQHISRLEAQVKQLIESTAGLHSARSGSELSSPPESIKEPTLTTNSTSSQLEKCIATTQTSRPITPLLTERYDTEKNVEEKLDSPQIVHVREVEEEEETEDNLSLVRSPESSIKLGESATTYNDDCIDIIDCDEILNKLLSPSSSAAPSTNDRTSKQSSSKSVDLVDATVDRLKQMGVSFISKENLGKKTIVDSRLPQYDYSLYQRPQRQYAEEPVSTCISTASSLAINSAALKYLDDDALSRMARAKASTKVEPNRQPNAGHVTSYGLSETDLTVGTKRFLSQFKAEGRTRTPLGVSQINVNSIGHSTSDSNFERLLRQPKL